MQLPAAARTASWQRSTSTILVPLSWVLAIATVAIQLSNLMALFCSPLFSHVLPAQKFLGSDGVSNFLGSTVAIILALWLVTIRPGWMTFALFLAMLDSANGYLPAWPLPHALAHAVTVLGLLFTYNAMWPVLVVFAVRFPSDDAPTGWQLWAQRCAIAVAVIAEAYVLALAIGPNGPRPSSATSIFNSFASGSILISALLLMARFAGVDARTRAQLRWATIGCVVGMLCSTTALAFVAAGFARVEGSLTTVAMLLQTFGTSLIAGVVVLPACVAYALVRTRYADPVFVLNRATVLTVTIALIALLVGGADWLIERFLAESGVALALQAAVTVALGFGLNRLHRHIESSVERVLFRKRYESAQYLRTLGQSLSVATHESVVEDAITADAARELDLASAALFRYVPEKHAFVRRRAVGWEETSAHELSADDPLIRFLKVARTPLRPGDARWTPGDVPSGIAAPALAIPMLLRGDVDAVVLYGAHSDHTEIDSAEAEELAELIERASAALDHVEAAALREALALAQRRYPAPAGNSL